MASLPVWVTIVHGVADTTAKDFQRADKVFAGVPLRFKPVKHILNRDQTRAILGSDGKLAISGGPKQFDHNLPAGVGSKAERPVTVQDPDGRSTAEAWAAITNWTDLGGVHVFYVPEFDRQGAEGGTRPGPEHWPEQSAITDRRADQRIRDLSPAWHHAHAPYRDTQRGPIDSSPERR
jgi:hypothetical protein